MGKPAYIADNPARTIFRRPSLSTAIEDVKKRGMMAIRDIDPIVIIWKRKGFNWNS